MKKTILGLYTIFASEKPTRDEIPMLVAYFIGLVLTLVLAVLIGMM